MDKSQKRYQAAMAVIKNDQAPLASKLVAHEELLRYGMPGAGDSAKLERIAEALGDLCLATSVVMTALSQPRTGDS